MKMTEHKFLFDSSTWLSYFMEENPKTKDFLENGRIFTSILSIFEIKRKLIKNDTKTSDIEKSISFIYSNSIILNLNLETINNAVEFSVGKKLATIDSLIYATSLLNNCVLITGDRDFEDLDNVILLE